MVNIYAYINYRKFLDDAYRERHAQNKKFNKALICKSIGLPNTRSYFIDIVTGRRNISNSKAELIARVFEFSIDESQFFRLLVQYNQAVLKDEKDFFFNQLVSLNKTPRQFITKKQYLYFSRWHHSAVRAALDILNIIDDYALLGSHISPPISAGKAGNSIKLLKSMGLIKRNKTGHWKPVEKNIGPGNELQAELIREFQMECLSQGVDILAKRKREFQRLTTKTISVSYDAMNKIIAKLEKFNSEVSSIVHKDEQLAQGIYQMNFHIYSKFDKPKA